MEVDAARESQSKSRNKNMNTTHLIIENESGRVLLIPSRGKWVLPTLMGEHVDLDCASMGLRVLWSSVPVSSGPIHVSWVKAVPYGESLPMTHAWVDPFKEEELIGVSETVLRLFSGAMRREEAPRRLQLPSLRG